MENGYEETTVAQIADRAGLNRATFFRHFADKREVLFGGEDVLAGLFADAIRAASAPTRTRRMRTFFGTLTWLPRSTTEARIKKTPSACAVS